LFACVVVGYWASIALGDSSAYGQVYSARGRIQVTTKLAANDAGKKETLGFYVEVVGQKYKIRMEESNRPDWYYEYAFDKHEMRTLHHVKRTPRDSSTNASPVFPARIEEREIPANDGTRAQFIWLAMASSRFFAGRTNEQMLPIWSPEDPQIRRQPFSMLTFVETIRESPALPAKVSFINDGFYRSYNPVKKALDVEPLSPPYDKGYTNAIYQVLAVTNTSTQTLPAHFVFAVYSSPIGAGEVPFERVLIRGVTSQVSDAAPEKAEIAGFDGLASVADYRIHGAVRRSGRVSEYKYAAYPVTNANWLNSTQLQATRSRVERRLEQKLAKAGNGNRKVVLTAVFVLSLVPLAWIFWRSVCQSRQQTTNTQQKE